MSVRRPNKTTVKRLHTQGLGRNAIARELNVSTRQVDNVARDLGLRFTTDRTYAASRVRESQAAQDRAELAEQARAEAHRLMGILKGLSDPVQIRRIVGAIAELLDIDVRATGATAEVTDREDHPEQFMKREADEVIASIELALATQQVAMKRVGTSHYS